MNNRQRMYATNSSIKKELIKFGFDKFYLFPHMRFNKDYNLEESSFDAFAWKSGMIWFLQFKTNKKPKHEQIIRYKLIESRYNCKCAWIARIKKNIIFFDVSNEKGIILNSRVD